MTDEQQAIVAVLERGEASPEEQKEGARIIRDLDNELREPDAQAVGAVGAVEHQNAIAHGGCTLSADGFWFTVFCTSASVCFAIALILKPKPNVWQHTVGTT